MEQEKRLPIGSQDFGDLRKGGFFYVDKTAYIESLVKDSKYFFLSRPRRFGKSLMLTTLAAYFEGKKELFKGLYLEQAEEELARKQGREAWTQHTVFLVDFSTGNYSLPNELSAKLHLFLSAYEERFHITFDPERENSFAGRFERLIKTAYEQTGKQVVVLIDEYDRALLQTFYREDMMPIYQANLNTLASFFSVLKGCDAYLRFGMISGVTRFSRVSIFSSINNLVDISMQEDYATMYGISERELEANFMPELEALAVYHNSASVSELLTLLRRRYDGYLFTRKGERVYNPFSLLHVLRYKDLGNYWFTGSTGSYLSDFLRDAELDIPALDGNIEYGALELESYKAVTEDPIPILFQSGYLSIKEYIEEGDVYRLGFPNDEVRYAFLSLLVPRVFHVHGSVKSLTLKFKRAVVEGRVDDFMEQLKSLISGCPYGKGVEASEDHYQTAVYLIFKLMGEWVRTEMHSARGRADCIVETHDTVYIFEFKLLSAGTPEDAIAQIKRQGYADQFRTEGKKLLLIGANFDEAARTLGEWRVEEA